MQNVVPTILAAALQSALYMGKTHVIEANTTLNEKLGILPGTLPPNGVNPILGYLAIGFGGHRFTAGANGIGFPQPYQHEATDFALFDQTPFVLRALNNDLDAPTRAKYAGRKIMTVGGVDYIAYMLRRIDLTNATIVSKIRTATGQAAPAYTEVTFTPSASNLSPTPQVISPTGANVISPDSVVATAPASIGMTADEAAEYVNAISILTGDPNLAIISEMALCSGVDKSITITTGGATVAFNEAIGVQINHHLAVFYSMVYTNQGISKVVDLGANSPLYNLTPA
jgi:hypothetical protein